MPVLVRASVDLTEGWAQLRFDYDPRTIAAIKSFPGAKWNKSSKTWSVPTNSLQLIQQQLPVQVVMQNERRFPIAPSIAEKLRPYQVAAVDFLVRRRGALLTMDMRTGKTPTAIAAAKTLLDSGEANALFVTGPQGLREQWGEELEKWAGLKLYTFEGISPASVEVLQSLHAASLEAPLAIWCGYEILQYHEFDVQAILAGRRYVTIADELHLCKNRKIKRTQLLWEIAHAQGQKVSVFSKHHDQEILFTAGKCVGRFGLTGTPIRNRPRDAWAMFQFVAPYSAGSYWTFAKRYCGAVQAEYGWIDDGETNTEELAARLKSISYRVTRAEVAPWLPKADFNVTLCEVPESQLKTYRKLEGAFAATVAKALKGDEGTLGERDALRQLVAETSAAKVPKVVERAYYHAEERGVKVIVFAHFHETLQRLETAFDKEKESDNRLPPHFIAGGWMTPDKRRKAIETWRECPGASILLVNTMSSGVGIDLADAEVALFAEVEWVPADLSQALARLQDMHKGKRVTPPVYEFLLVRGTIDEAMTRAVLKKVRAIDAIVGMDAETSGLATTLRGAGVVEATRLGLPSTDDETVKAALASIRDRWLKKESSPKSTSVEDLAGDLAAAFTEDEQEEEEEDEED